MRIIRKRSFVAYRQFAAHLRKLDQFADVAQILTANNRKFEFNLSFFLISEEKSHLLLLSVVVLLVVVVMVVVVVVVVVLVLLVAILVVALY